MGTRGGRSPAARRSTRLVGDHEPTDSTDPTDPIDSTDPLDAIDSKEFSDHDEQDDWGGRPRLDLIPPLTAGSR